MNGSHRWIENGLAILGGLLAATYVIGVEVVPHVSYGLGRCQAPPAAEGGFPWGVAMVIAALVLPKTVGRATSGRVWSALSGLAPRVGGRGSQGGPNGAA